MRLKYHNDGKERDMSHELHLEFDYEETNVMDESREEVVLAMQRRVRLLIDRLQNINWDYIEEVDCFGRPLK